MYIGIPVWTEKPRTPRTQFFYSFQHTQITHTHTMKRCKDLRTAKRSIVPLGVPWPMNSAANPSPRLRSSYDRACIIIHHTPYIIYVHRVAIIGDERNITWTLKLRPIICFRSLKHRYKYWLNHRATLSRSDFVRSFEISKEQPTRVDGQTDRRATWKGYFARPRPRRDTCYHQTPLKYTKRYAYRM